LKYVVLSQRREAFGVTLKVRVALKRVALFLGAAALSTVGMFAQTKGSAAADSSPGAIKQEAPKANPTATDLAGGTGLAIDTKSYIIGPEDILFISVWREDSLTHQYGVRPDGKITVPLVKDIQAGGLTPERLGEQLTQALSEYFNKPEVTVTVVQVNSKKFFIAGEVNHPGQYPLVTSIKVFDALNAAGGFKDFANKKTIVIIRGKDRLKFNYEEVLKGKKLEQNIPVENEDTIVVK
jgi:polysaccharide export outer membrane protein